MSIDYTIRKIEEYGSDRFYYQVIKYTTEFSKDTCYMMPTVLKTTKTRGEAERILARKNIHTWSLEREVIKTHAFIDCIV